MVTFVDAQLKNIGSQINFTRTNKTKLLLSSQLQHLESHINKHSASFTDIRVVESRDDSM